MSGPHPSPAGRTLRLSDPLRRTGPAGGPACRHPRHRGLGRAPLMPVLTFNALFDDAACGLLRTFVRVLLRCETTSFHDPIPPNTKLATAPASNCRAASV